MTTRKKPRRRAARTLAGLAAFVLLCGAVLLLASGSPADSSSRAKESAGSTGPAVEERISRALRQARSAERALIDANYGEVNQHLRRLDNTLSELLDQLGDQ